MLFLSNALLQLMGFVYRMALTKNAGASALGLNSLVMQLYSIIVSVCISGLNVAVSTLAARLDKNGIAPLARLALFAYTALWFLMAAPFFILRNSISVRVLGDAGSSATITVMLVCIFMTGIENMLKSLHFGTGNVLPCAVSELTEQGVRFLLVTLLLKKLSHDTDTETVLYIMLGMTLSELVSVSFLSVSFLRKFPRGDGGGSVKLKDIAGVAFPATMTSVASTVFASAGSLLLPAALVSFGMTRNDALSIIGVMNTVYVPITMLPMALVGAVASVVMPEISMRRAKGNPVDVLIKKAFLAAAGFSAGLLTLLYCFSGVITNTFFGLEPDRKLLFLLTVKAFIICCQVISVAVLNGLLKQRTVLLFAVTGEAYQLAMILLLVPRLGILGCALGMIIGEALRLICNLFAVNSGKMGKDVVESDKRLRKRLLWLKR